MTASLKMTRLDFYTMKSQLTSYLALVAIALFFMFMGTSVSILCFTCAWFVVLMSSSIFVIQEKNCLDNLYGSLSVRPQDIVLGRYIFVFLSYLVSLFVIMLLYSGFALVQNIGLNGEEFWLGFGLSFGVFCFIAGIQMPIFFKLGYTKAKIWSFVPFMAVMILFIIPPFVDALSGFVELMMSNKSALMIGAVLGGWVILFFSYLISVAVYRKRR